MKKGIGAGILLLIVVAAGLYWSDPPPSLPPETLAEVAPDVGSAIDPAPAAPTRPPGTVPVVADWGPCVPDLARRQIEDQALRTVLASRVENDPLFGYPERTMQMAECAARRWRLEGR